MSQKIKLISDAPNAPRAVGPYSQAAVVGSLAFCSGQIPLVPETGKLIEGGIDAQVTQVLANIEALLKHLGVGFSAIVKSTVFLTDLKNFQVMNQIYEHKLASHKPARSTIQVAGLPLGSQVEIEVVVAMPVA